MNRPKASEFDSPAPSLRATAEQCRGRFGSALLDRNVDEAAAAALDLEQAITDWGTDTLSSDDGDHAHGVLRSMVVELGELARTGAADPTAAIRPYVELLITLRSRAREANDFVASDQIRDSLTSFGVEVRDTATGPIWSPTSSS